MLIQDERKMMRAKLYCYNMWLRITEYDSARNEVVPLVKHLLASEVIRVDFVSRILLGKYE